eukprot:3032348-Rhodomonas_salina.3
MGTTWRCCVRCMCSSLGQLVLTWGSGTEVLLWGTEVLLWGTEVLLWGPEVLLWGTEVLLWGYLGGALCLRSAGHAPQGS